MVDLSAKSKKKTIATTPNDITIWQKHKTQAETIDSGTFVNRHVPPACL